MTPKSTLVGAALLALGVAASDAHAENSGNVLEGVAMTGSESMMLYALSNRHLPEDFHQARAVIAYRAGLLGKPGEVTDGWIRFSPVLTYDGNINGGSVGESVNISGLEFRVADDFRAKAGLLVGARVNAGLRMNVGELTAPELDGSAMAAWSPEHAMTKTQVTASACLRRMANDQVQVRGCLDGYHSSYELGETKRLGAEVGVSYGFATFASFHEVDASVQQSRYFDEESYNQTVATVRYTNGRTGPVAIMAGLQIGSKVEDQIAMREALMAGVATTVFDRPTNFIANSQFNRGGMFLGEERAENIYGVSVNHAVNDRLAVGLSYSVTDAKHDFFNENAFGMNFNVRF